MFKGDELGDVGQEEEVVVAIEVKVVVAAAVLRYTVFASDAERHS